METTMAPAVPVALLLVGVAASSALAGNQATSAAPAPSVSAQTITLEDGSTGPFNPDQSREFPLPARSARAEGDARERRLGRLFARRAAKAAATGAPTVILQRTIRPRDAHAAGTFTREPQRR